VAIGEIVAEIRTPLGEITEQVRSPVNGFVLSFPRYHNQAVMTGDHVVFIASTDEMTDGTVS
jgi:predicted deacylase